MNKIYNIGKQIIAPLVLAGAVAYSTPALAGNIGSLVESQTKNEIMQQDTEYVAQMEKLQAYQDSLFVSTRNYNESIAKARENFNDSIADRVFSVEEQKGLYDVLKTAEQQLIVVNQARENISGLKAMKMDEGMKNLYWLVEKNLYCRDDDESPKLEKRLADEGLQIQVEGNQAEAENDDITYFLLPIITSICTLRILSLQNKLGKLEKK